MMMGTSRTAKIMLAHRIHLADAYALYARDELVADIAATAAAAAAAAAAPVLMLRDAIAAAFEALADARSAWAARILLLLGASTFFVPSVTDDNCRKRSHSSRSWRSKVGRERNVLYEGQT